MIATNWLLLHRTRCRPGGRCEASLGYYIFPLLAVALGFLVLGERFSLRQALAIALAALAVLVLTVGLGAAPWIGAAAGRRPSRAYGLIKNRVPLGPVISVFVETLLLAPLALRLALGAAHRRLDRPRRPDRRHFGRRSRDQRHAGLLGAADRRRR